MDHQRPYIELCAQRPHPLGLRRIDLRSPPHPRARRKNLECIRANFLRALHRIGGAARRPEVHSDPLFHSPILNWRTRSDKQTGRVPHPSRALAAWVGKQRTCPCNAAVKLQADQEPRVPHPSRALCGSRGKATNPIRFAPDPRTRPLLTTLSSHPDPSALPVSARCSDCSATPRPRPDIRIPHPPPQACDSAPKRRNS